MDSDDDYQSFSLPKEPSPQVHHRRLKRLKKSNSKPLKDLLPDPIDDPLLFPQVDFARLEALENDSEFPEFNDLNSSEELVLSQESLSLGIRNENETENEEKMECRSDVEVKKTKRMLEFDGDAAEVHGNGRAVEEASVGFEQGENEKERFGEEDLFEEKEDDKKKKEDEKKKKRRVKSDSGELKANVRGSNKRREEKERKAYLKELHAESQRVLRETRDASFKPMPVVQKPISSVLEKIRKRKLEISRKMMVVNDRSYGYEENSRPSDKMLVLDVSIEERGEENVEIIVEKETIAPLDGDISLAASGSNEFKDAAKQTIHANDQNQVSPNEEPISAFPAAAPVHTQDLEPNSAKSEQTDEQLKSPSDEDFAPYSLAMDLQFDSVSVGDSSSDEEDNDKENVDPHPLGIADGNSSPKGDPVKDFVDDEAEEEDDSDNDLRFQDNEEDENIEDLEELNDIIATEYEERPTDNERRNELHQKWLEQQDAAGTDHLMQRLKCGSVLKDTFLSDKEPEIDDDDDEFDDEAKEDFLPQNSARVNTRKAKQIILQLLPDKEDAYLSDDDDDTQRRLAQCLLMRKEEQATLVSPADDESCREVFGLIKKLNIVSDNKRKPKAFSFDSVLKGGNNNNSSKSSFLGRVTNHQIPSSHKQGSGTFRSFIFGRDDSNSRSSISMSEDSSDTVSKEIRPTRAVTAKYSNTQTKMSNQTTDAAAETVSRTSLLEILKRSSAQSRLCNQETTVDLTKSIFAFRAPKKPTKIEGRS
ncbi:myb-like protein X isoform X2 [Sesamum indicum]|uniref:Myb-like protein X isoform X2 n=1 Tax=Sesamum indicum TaxID=4182 RepID=A0A8M8V3G2_SESIN|nr:myb-like protein X isoform X2 [Sesamum indicum]